MVRLSAITGNYSPGPPAHGAPGLVRPILFWRASPGTRRVDPAGGARRIGEEDLHVPALGQTTGEDNPDAVIFYARPEVLSGFFTLANFDQADPNGGVICPFGSGCNSIVHYPWLEQQKAKPKAVLGMFDPSARPCVPVECTYHRVPDEKIRESRRIQWRRVSS